MFGLAVARSPAQADLAAPSWWGGPNATWHYRVPVNVPAAAVNSTVVVEVDFAALLSQLGITGTFDANSPRVVRPGSSLAAEQQFTDRVYAAATDSAGNARGEIRFILEDAGPSTYYLYFDITENGTKPANPQPPINGNFEFGGTGSQNPPGGWTGTRINTNYDAEIRPSETVNVTTDATGVTATPNPVNTDGTPLTGGFSYLLGARSNNENATGFTTTLTRTFTVPATNPGNITVNYRIEGWDASDDGSTTQWDVFTVELLGAGTSQLVGPAGSSPTYVNFPFAPNKGLNTSTNTRSGYGQYNGWDCDRRGRHRSGMTVACYSEPWWTRTASLAGFAGQTVTLRIRWYQNTFFRSWAHLDDIEWSRVDAVLGTPEGFGVNITQPLAAPALSAGSVVSITAVVDAAPTQVVAEIFDDNGVQVASGIPLFDDGTHGDAVAGDGTWTNDGSVPADPTYTILGSDPAGPNWKVLFKALDASTSTLGVTNGLVHIPGQATTELQANFFNIDEQLFEVSPPVLSVAKSQSVVDDFVSAANAKAIPGARVRYMITLDNNSASTPADAVVVRDAIPANTSFVPGSIVIDGVPQGDNSGDGDDADYNVTTPGAVTATVGTLAPSTTTVIMFDVVVD